MHRQLCIHCWSNQSFNSLIVQILWLIQKNLINNEANCNISLFSLLSSPSIQYPSGSKGRQFQSFSKTLGGREVVKVFHSLFCIAAITNHIQNEGCCNSFSSGKKKKKKQTIFNIIAQTVFHYANLTCQNVETYSNILLGSSHLSHYLCDIYCSDHSIHICTINSRLALELIAGKRERFNFTF